MHNSKNDGTKSPEGPVHAVLSKERELQGYKQQEMRKALQLEYLKLWGQCWS